MPIIETKGAASSQGFGQFASTGDAVYIESVFQTWLYTGNGSTQTITNGIDLSTKGGLVWIKARSEIRAHYLFNTISGPTKALVSNSTTAEVVFTTPQAMSSFNSNGFTLGADNSTNNNNTTFASWTFREQPKFFDVVTYTGTGANRTVAHNLGSVPGCIIVKCTSSSGLNWQVYHRSLGATKNIILNLTDAEASNGNIVWNSTAPTSTVFSLGTAAAVNDSGATYVAYLFAHNAGGFGPTGTDNVISCGSVTTDGSGFAAVDLGYEPQWVLFKKSNVSGNWNIVDNMRGWTNNSGGNQPTLLANSSAAEASAGVGDTLSSTGFRLFGNASDAFIYIAIRRGPMKTPTTGTSVFNTVLSTSATASMSVGFPPDSVFQRSQRTTTTNSFFTGTRLTGNSAYLQTWTTDAEGSFLSWRFDAPTNNFTQSLYSGSGFNAVDYFFRRAPGFFDVVCYTGTGSATTQAHNLGVAPEMIIIKDRISATNWTVYTATTGTGKGLYLNSTSAEVTFGQWVTSTSSTTFGLGNGTNVNGSGDTYVAYLFATVSGVSKVGSYTGTGALQTINCGFTGGARFVLIKRTDSTGDWYVWDSARGIVAGNDPYLLLNSTAAEVTNTDWVDTHSPGFELSNSAGNLVNTNGGTYIFLAIA